MPNRARVIILLKGLTPIPYKLVTITSGFAGYNIWLFILCSIVMRAAGGSSWSRSCSTATANGSGSGSRNIWACGSALGAGVLRARLYHRISNDLKAA